MHEFSRRDSLRLALGAALGGAFSPLTLTREAAARDAPPAEPKTVAAVATIYTNNSHADVILGKILEGWRQDGGPGPALKLVSLYVDQFPERDLSREMSRKFGFPIFDTIEGALTLGGDRIPVDGVLSIGEHGDYPYNELGQHLYPRRRFFEEIAATFEKFEQVVPVFSDKHLGPAWADARWMYDRARELEIPLMAGSSLPVGYRHGEIDLPMDCEIETAVGIGYSGLDVYGIHALEFFQYHVERRRGAERGVKSVQFLEGAELWNAVDQGLVSQAALDAAFEVVPKKGSPDIRQDDKAALFVFDYLDGLRGAILMLGCVSGTALGVTLKNRPQPLAVAFDERTQPRYPHFAYLLKAIETMIHTGRPAYPVERTLLTSGILDRVLTSRARDGELLQTPELAISYQPVDYPHAPRPDLSQPPSPM
jgi:hypothetical protein